MIDAWIDPATKITVALRSLATHFVNHVQNAVGSEAVNYPKTLNLPTTLQVPRRLHPAIESLSENLHRTVLHVQKQNPNGDQNACTSPKGRASAREYYNKRYEEVDKKQRSIGLYADTTNMHIDRIEGLWREYVTTYHYCICRTC